jgi:hypothetical protein
VRGGGWRQIMKHETIGRAEDSPQKTIKKSQFLAPMSGESLFFVKEAAKR